MQCATALTWKSRWLVAAAEATQRPDAAASSGIPCNELANFAAELSSAYGPVNSTSAVVSVGGVLPKLPIQVLFWTPGRTFVSPACCRQWAGLGPLYPACPGCSPGIVVIVGAGPVVVGDVGVVPVAVDVVVADVVGGVPVVEVVVAPEALGLPFVGVLVAPEPPRLPVVGIRVVVVGVGVLVVGLAPWDAGFGAPELPVVLVVVEFSVAPASAAPWWVPAGLSCAVDVTWRFAETLTAFDAPVLRPFAPSDDPLSLACCAAACVCVATVWCLPGSVLPPPLADAGAVTDGTWATFELGADEPQAATATGRTATVATAARRRACEMQEMLGVIYGLRVGAPSYWRLFGLAGWSASAGSATPCG